MKEPNHKVKRHFVPFSDKEAPHWVHYPVHGWLGSGVTDKNGVEIFEGDIIIDDGDTSTVTFKDGSFWAFGQILEHFTCTNVEVVGHVTEDDQ